MSMQLGFGLHPKWIEGTTRETFLALLKAAGMSVLEFTLHPGAEEWQAMRALAEECVQAGYHCHFHAPYQMPFTLAGFSTTQRDTIERMYAPALELVERLAGEQRFDPALVIHGATADAPREALRRDTEEFLAWVLAETRHARLMLEILPHKPPLTRIGASRDELLGVVRKMDEPRLGICWDLGHDYLIGYAELPCDEFLHAVRHVHIHDVNAAHEDHFPLIFGNVPWQTDLRALSNVGFNGAVILEINGYRAASIDRLHERLAESFAAMSERVR